jgi:hypothetical protein
VFYIEENRVRVTEINYPAITICPGLVLSDNSFTILDYDRAVDAWLKNGTSIENLKEKE